jgi:UDP-perosamine 4-acetyltransferase
VSIKPVIILGAGGHAKVLADALKLSGREILGFVTPDTDVGMNYCGKKVLGDDSIIEQYSADEIELVNGIGALPTKNLRWLLADKMRKQGYKFAIVIHPDAIITADVDLLEGTQIMAGVVIQSGTKIGQDTIINTGALIDHDCQIGNQCHIAPGVIFSGGINIGSNTHLGTGAIVIQNISIGENCVISAGSIVYKDISDGAKIIHGGNN